MKSTVLTPKPYALIVSKNQNQYVIDEISFATDFSYEE